MEGVSRHVVFAHGQTLACVPRRGCGPRLSETPAVAGDDSTLVCVAPNGETPELPEDCAAGIFQSFAEALESPASLGAEFLVVTLLGGPESAPLEESLRVDSRGLAFENSLHLQMHGRPLCPDVDAPPGEPLIELITGGSSTITDIHADLGPSGCDSPRPGVTTWGGGVFNIAAAELVGYESYGFASGLGGEPGHMALGWVSIRNGVGPAVRAGGELSLGDAEIIGNVIPDDSAAPALVWIEATSIGAVQGWGGSRCQRRGTMTSAPAPVAALPGPAPTGLSHPSSCSRSRSGRSAASATLRGSVGAAGSSQNDNDRSCQGPVVVIWIPSYYSSGFSY